MATWCKRTMELQWYTGESGNDSGHYHTTQRVGTPSPHRLPPLTGSHQRPHTTRCVGGFTNLSRVKHECLWILATTRRVRNDMRQHGMQFVTFSKTIVSSQAATACSFLHIFRWFSTDKHPVFMRSRCGTESEKYARFICNKRNNCSVFIIRQTRFFSKDFDRNSFVQTLQKK